MDEFLKQNYTFIIYSVEIIAALTGLCCYRKFKNTKVKYFILFLAYVLIMEIIGYYPWVIKDFIKDSRFAANYWYFTIFWSIASTLFFTLYFRMNLSHKHYRTILIYGLILYLVSVLINLSMNGNLFSSVRPIYITLSGFFLILMSIAFYFIEILRSGKILNIHHSFSFYAATILLLWLLITTPLNFYNSYFKAIDWNFVFLKWQIMLFANTFMYLSFTFALIYCKPEHD